MRIFSSLTFDNGAIVATLQDLLDALRGMDDEIFKVHVNESKNDILEWINNVVGDDVLSKKLEGVTKKEDIVKILEKEKRAKRKVVVESGDELQDVKRGSDGFEDATILIESLSSALESRNLAKAKELYYLLVEVYKELSKEDKAKLYNRGVELHKMLVALELFVSREV